MASFVPKAASTFVYRARRISVRRGTTRTPDKCWRTATVAVHADNAGLPELSHDWDVAPPIGVTSTFERRNGQAPHTYSRTSCPTRSRCEQVLSSLEAQGGVPCRALLFSSGLSAVHGALSVLCRGEPAKRLLISGGYHGTHAVIAELKATGATFEVAPLPGPEGVIAGDVVWLETPKNPTSELYDVAEYAARGADVIVDATLAPPPLQYPLAVGARVVVHAATKALAGHSDVVAGVVVAADEGILGDLERYRHAVGCVPGSFETWLLLRSLRTLDLRLHRQATSAAELARWLRSHDKVVAVHSSAGSELARRQMKDGLVGGTFAIELQTEEMATKLPAALTLFKDATSLGGCESLAEWRRRYDDQISPRLVRISVGLEHPEDLRCDFERALDTL